MNAALFFFKLAYKYKIRLFFLLSYSIISGYYISFWPILIKQIANFDAKFYLILIAAMHFSFNYIKELILFPIHNYATYIFKSNMMNNSYDLSLDEIEPGKIISSLQRSGFTRYFFKNIIDCFKYGAMILHSIYLIYSKNHNLAFWNLLLLAVYFLAFIYYKNYYKKLRSNAWQSTELAGIAQENMLNQITSIKQNLINNKTNFALENEYKKWHEYYLKSNILFIIFNIFLLLILIIPIAKNFEQTILFLIWNLASSINLISMDIKNIISINTDLEIFLRKNPVNKTKNQFSLNKDNLIIQNLYIHKKNNDGKIITLGPFNFSTNKMKAKKIIALTGGNGAGKTQIALAISQLIEYDGAIEAPHAIYISLKDKIASFKSQGENAFLVIENAFKKAMLEKSTSDGATHDNYGLIIIDELLDILSAENLQIIIGKIKNMNKMFLIITHSNEIKKIANMIWKI